MQQANDRLPKIGLLYLDHVLRFFDESNFKGWTNKIETVVYHWGNDKQRFIEEVRQKKIDILIGNVPATAYECFREIERELPDVQFIPSMDTQFANKSKENVTHFCEKYCLPIPSTHIFYEKKQADAFLRNTIYPKIIKRSYGPSNYGGYYVHKVDNEAEAHSLLAEKKYYPIYLQDFIPMKADIRVMLIGHKPACAFWRRPPEGEWLTNTSQGGSMDYMHVPEEALELAVRASKAANAEYWACDIAVSFDDEYRILECATAFAAFPYIRDWIGQYLIWKLSSGMMPCPNIPLYSWEELGKLSSSVLRTMRYITFNQHHEAYSISETGETFHRIDSNGYPIIQTYSRHSEEWPSEVWNRQDNYTSLTTGEKNASTNVDAANTEIDPNVVTSVTADEQHICYQATDTGIEDIAIPVTINQVTTKASPSSTAPPSSLLSESRMIELLTSARGISKKLAEMILNTLGLQGLTEALQKNPEKLTQIKNIKAKRLANIMESWEAHLKTS
ncbi:MAG: hypothetical protein PUP46_02805 [Endozoicomonas sp. (ex Botrylloides leachii)]|nr:hypothetical protein [Endozoicomonas sp. (ex Botrylloides leachii)]